MNTAELLETDPCFRRLFINFAHQLNPNVDWQQLVELWISRKKNEEQMMELFRSAVWTDKSIDWDEDEFPRFVNITKSLFDYKEKSIIVLDYNPEYTTINAEREMEEYRDVLIAYLQARGIEYEFKSFIKIKPNDFIFDYGWFFLSEKELKLLLKMKNRIHFNFLGIEAIVPEYIPHIRRFYETITASRNDS